VATRLTKAFEEYLVRELVPNWTTADDLTIHFLTAFAAELSPRFGLADRVCRVGLSADDVAFVNSSPQVDPKVKTLMQTFQS